MAKSGASKVINKNNRQNGKPYGQVTTPKSLGGKKA